MTVARPFKILVPCKRVIDYAVKIRVKPDLSGVEKLNVKHSLNPFDEIALEESLRLKEKATQSVISEILALSIGPKQCQDTLRTALAMGADRAIHVEHENENDLQPILVSLAIQKILQKETDIGVVLLGKQAIDDDSGQTGQILAGLLNWPQATFASKVILNDKEGKAVVTREIDNGLEVISSNLPVIITTDLRLNEPRYATLQNIMKAKSKPFQKETLQSLGIKVDSYIKHLKMTEPPKRKAGVKIESIDELVKIIRNI